MHIPTVIKLLSKADINIRHLADELFKSSMNAGEEVIKTLFLEDESYSFKVQRDFTESISLYASDDDGVNWQWVESFSL
jgi:hypothetical protein